MISPVAAMTTVRYEATYQWAGLTQLNAASGVVPNEPPMISIVTTGKTKTKITVSGSRVISISSVRTRRPAAVVIGAVVRRGGRSSEWPSRTRALVRLRLLVPVQQAEQRILQGRHPHGQVSGDVAGRRQRRTDIGDRGRERR